jgi:hypothetical protein
MNLLMQEGQFYSELHFDKWDVAFLGKHSDERGKAACDFLKPNSSEVFAIEYKPEDFQIVVNDKVIEVDDLDDNLPNFVGKSVIVESTTLGFAEIIIVLKALINQGVNGISFLYLEPGSYYRQQQNNVLHRRDFDLSKQIPGFQAIPGFSFLLTEESVQKVVFFPGYESARLERALEDYQMIKSERCILVFGVPAFKAGWEMNSFANNLRIIKEKRLSGDIYYGAANNPLATIDLLNKIRNGLQEDEQMFVVPLGTKPEKIGIALFVLINNNIGLLYDHPEVLQGRTDKVSKWHLYEVAI